MKLAYSSSRQDGTVLTELAISLPFLMLLLFMVLEIGRLIGQISWVAQTGFEALMVGNYFVESVGRERMENVRTVFQAHTNQGLHNLDLNPDFGNVTTLDRNGNVVPMISVNLRGAMDSMSYLNPFRLGFRLVGPNVAGDLGLPGDSRFAVIGADQYNCDMHDPQPCDPNVPGDCPVCPCIGDTPASSNVADCSYNIFP